MEFSQDLNQQQNGKTINKKTIKIYPNNSLSPKGFFLLMAFITIPCLTIGIMFMVMGAWPVLGFMVLEVFLIYIFFHTIHLSYLVYLFDVSHNIYNFVM